MKNFPYQVNRLKKVALKQSEKIADKAKLKKDQTSGFLHEVGSLTIFFLRFFKELFTPPFELKETIRQCFMVGNKSLGLVSITGVIMGLVLTIQSRPTLADFGAESWLPGMVAVSIVREIGPVITALICAGKVGSSIGAELGSMKVTEQIEAMEVSGTNPYEYLVVTRILATTLMVPLLVIYSDAMGFVGSFIGVNIKGDVNFFLFCSQAFASLEFIDIIPATIKTIFFGFVIGFVGCYKGYNAGSGTESVGRAANASVVAGSLLIFLVDMVAVQITDMFFTS
jgi:phospholipid/cholesterol/gamma-HCH transport system permease protein